MTNLLQHMESKIKIHKSMISELEKKPITKRSASEIESIKNHQYVLKIMEENVKILKHDLDTDNAKL